MLKKWVFSRRRNVVMELTVRSDSGREFQTKGPETQNALSPSKTASDAWRYNNPVYKLTTDKLQLMLINKLFDQFLNIKFSQGSVATRLRCDGIFNDQFTT